MSKLKDQIVENIKATVFVLNDLFGQAAKMGIEVYIKTIDHSLSSSNKTNTEIKVTLKEIL